jgi:hypothetical protein
MPLFVQYRDKAEHELSSFPRKDSTRYEELVSIKERLCKVITLIIFLRYFVKFSEFSASFQITRTRQLKRAWDAQRSVVLHPQNSPPRVPRPSQSTKCVPHYTSSDQDTLFGHLTVLPTAAWLHLKLSYLPF